ncbi:hypothetical protein CEK28_14250 [Xenophilus sp. AP218F]|nr:transporter substrate-binding domain-containing protein [Chromobacterium sp. ASV5]OWY38082.1 hypothetical protein CEK28_14250 [Xenophilus sp. AP218F]
MAISARRRLLACLFLFSACCRAQAPDRLIVDLDAGNPPFMYADPRGAASGLYPRLIAAACRQAGIPLTLRALSWRRALYELRQGGAAVGGIYKTAEREKRYDFSQPLFQERIVLVYPQLKPLVFRRLADLDGLRVGVIAGWSYGDAFDQARSTSKFSAYEADNDSQNLQLLTLGRLDAALGVQEAMQAALRDGRHRGLAIAPTPLAINATFLAVNKNARQQALLPRFNQALDKMRRDGSYQRLVQSFFSGDAR